METTAALIIRKREVWAALRPNRRRVEFLIVAAIVFGLIALYLTNGARGAPLT